MEIQEAGELRNKISICIEDYIKETGKFPDKLILTKKTVELLAANQLDSKTITEGTKIDTYRINELPRRVLRKIEEKQRGMEYPLILCRKGWFNNFADITYYNLNVSLSSLAQALAA